MSRLFGEMKSQIAAGEMGTQRCTRYGWKERRAKSPSVVFFVDLIGACGG